MSYLYQILVTVEHEGEQHGPFCFQTPQYQKKNLGFKNNCLNEKLPVFIHLSITAFFPLTPFVHLMSEARSRQRRYSLERISACTKIERLNHRKGQIGSIPGQSRRFNTKTKKINQSISIQQSTFEVDQNLPVLVLEQLCYEVMADL